MRKKPIRASDLHRVGEAYNWPERPEWGSRVQLNSGGPEMLIVADADGRAVCAWAYGEATFDHRCLRPA